MTMYEMLTDCNSLVFKKLEAMTKKAEALKAEAQRIEELNRILVYRIQMNRLTNPEDIDCAISWLEHSNLSVDEIIKKI